MEPAFQRGDILFLSLVEEELVAGDVVVFQIQGTTGGEGARKRGTPGVAGRPEKGRQKGESSSRSRVPPTSPHPH